MAVINSESLLTQADPGFLYQNDFRQYIESFSPLSDRAFSLLWPLVRFKLVLNGTYLLRVNQIARDLLFVCDGILYSEYLTADGTKHIKNFFVAGNFAGSTVSMLELSPSAFAIQVLEDAKVFLIDFRKYRALIHREPELARFYIAYLERNWVIKNERKQISFATQTATERYLTFLKEYPGLDRRVSQLNIAAYLGITPTQLCRIKNNL